MARITSKSALQGVTTSSALTTADVSALISTDQH